jgi:hypothetical protein
VNSVLSESFVIIESLLKDSDFLPKGFVLSLIFIFFEALRCSIILKSVVSIGLSSVVGTL